VEGFGLQGLEALASGATVLASPIPAHHEILGDAAAYSASCSSDDLARALAELWNDESRRGSLAARGPQRAALFPWDVLGDKTLELYRRVTFLC
jgi:glycosyltransferase involved in cell wall biosynthesis